ncbi:hypothetical protein [Actinocrispum wychmicini]|uniref:Uncharacterized protein n=1 Tax=Actinocrispum wychmicini TaxID=1213861 RepID=A0A4R2JKE9_9PSEU|nr:hypothetical protein [Actinocrispum wychmicini]TCO59287.1 hypothetical protein EV192_104128 [Actinocrispum wychmicini]
MTRTPTSPSGPSPEIPAAPSATGGRGHLSTWLAAYGSTSLIGLSAVLACFGSHLLVAGAVTAGWTLLGVGGAATVAAAGVGTALWWRHHHHRRCDRSCPQ